MSYPFAFLFVRVITFNLSAVFSGCDLERICCSQLSLPRGQQTPGTVDGLSTDPPDCRHSAPAASLAGFPELLQHKAGPLERLVRIHN